MGVNANKVFVCDLGFSALKYFWKGDTGRIISAYQRRGDGIVYGEEAMVLSGSSCLNTPVDLIEHYPEFIKHAASVAKVSGDGLLLVLGLPHQYWERESNNKRDGLQSAITILEKNCLFKPFSKVLVFPQGLGGIKSFLSEGPAVGAERILGIDIGFNTVIYSIFDNKTGKTVHSNTLYNRGVSQMAEKQLRPIINNLSEAKSYSSVEISYLLEQGFIQDGTERIDITQQVQKAFNEYISDTVRDVVGTIRSRAGVTATFDQIVFFGGGARLIKGVVPAKNVRINILADPEFGNARGFASLGEKWLDARPVVKV